MRVKPAHPTITLSLFVAGLAQPVSAVADSPGYTATLPTLLVEATSELSQTKGYVGYEEANVTRNNLTIREVPQTIDVINIQKNKNYGTNDLSSILEGNAGVDASYDMRGENIFLRGFKADANDIYRDGIRSSGQVRRSTANIERVEILKGPASVLYGRSTGGGVINLVSKSANFTPTRVVGVNYGSWADRSATLDVNEVVNDNVAVRLTGEIGRANAFRSGIESENEMLSPSVLVASDDGRLTWEAQYTYDNAWRVPDRGPSKSDYDLMGIDYHTGFAHPGDYVEDTLHFVRSSLGYQFADDWEISWLIGYRQAEQNFDHHYAGRYSEDDGLLSRNYAWQETDNKTLTNTLRLTGEVTTGPLSHKITLGLEDSREERVPKVGFVSGLVNIDPRDPSSWPRPDRANAPIRFDNVHETETQSLFVQDLIGLTPALKVMLGARIDDYEFQTTNIDDVSNRYDDTVFSPSAGVVWDLARDHTAYASYSQSFSPYGGQGYLGISATADSDTFNTDPEENRQYEIGLKSDWLDQRLTSTVSLYQIEHRNIRYRPDPDNDPFRWAERGQERSRGIELSLIGQIVDHWFLRSSVGVMSAKVVDNVADPAEEGRHLDNTSNVTGNAFVRYVPDDQWYGELGVTHLGDRYNYNRDGSAAHLDGFTRVDAMVGWQWRDWSTTLAVHNLLDTDYWRSSSMPGEPRSVYGRLSYQF
ncbi:TonB-dependent receptor [Marinobacter xestospongiae]|uniref:TonB-dependent receptor n=1 Tax=Marinobacter xestospongiae TaxID=994319 RepID=UPI00200388BD|nr:TonB-dependent siderophore receptor [Marinobacter xestospongiae]MCK7565561.1 TonB-dependent siderophore receptor [Marinobacter xestospongiae]